MSVWSWIVWIVIIILWFVMFAGSIVIIVTLSRVITRIKDGNSEDSISQSEATFGLVCSIFLLVGLIVMAIYIIYKYIKTARNASKLKDILVNGTNSAVTASFAGASGIASNVLPRAFNDIAVTSANITATELLDKVGESVNSVLGTYAISNPDCNLDLNSIGNELKNTLQTRVEAAARTGANAGVAKGTSSLQAVVTTIAGGAARSTATASSATASAAAGAITGSPSPVMTNPVIDPSLISTGGYMPLGSDDLMLRGGYIPPVIGGRTLSCNAFGLPIAGNFINDPAIGPDFTVGNPVPGYTTCTDGGNPPCGSRQDYSINLTNLPRGGYTFNQFRS